MNIDSIIAAWEEQLRGQPPTDLGLFWDQTPDIHTLSRTERQALLLELIALELEVAWKASQVVAGLPRRTASEYAELFPELIDNGLLVELMAEEYRVRSRFGDRPSHAAFLTQARLEHQAALQVALYRVDQQLQAEFGKDSLPPNSIQNTAHPRSGPLPFDPRAPLSSADYLVQRFIGAGSLGRVYSARQHSLDRSVALKFLRKSYLSNQGAVDRFLQEARIAGGLRHPGIVSVHGLGRTPGGSYFIAMDLVPGMPLLVIDPHDPRQLRSLIDSLAQTAAAIAVAHEAGVIHCDLKPANILRDGQGRVTITDFGLARQLADDSLVSLRGEGTPACIAPEQVDGCWGPISTATDVFNLAATLFLLMTGKSPHEGETVVEILASAVSGRAIPRLSDRLPGIPAELDEICAQCLSKSPNNRHFGMAELANRLQQFAGQFSARWS